MRPSRPLDPERPRRPVGRARVGRATGRASLPEHPPTSVLRIGEQLPAPEFVDPSGSRRRRVRRISYLLCVSLLLALLVVWLSQLGAPAEPPSVGSCRSKPAG